jgi:hypothetical protein
MRLLRECYLLLGITHPSDPLCRYMGVCLADVQRGRAFPAYMRITFVFPFHSANLISDASRHASDGPLPIIEYEYTYRDRDASEEI